jgi:membrane-bound lytic murein transglycosylase B
MNVQRGLAARGYDIGTMDGVIGTRTKDAISDFQRRSGLTVTGVATAVELNRLR